MSRTFGSAVLVLCLVVAGRTASADLIINVNYSGDSQYAAAFTSAAQTWQNLLRGYQNGVVALAYAGSGYSIGQTVSTVTINANLTAIDGAGGTLGSAGPTSAVVDQAGFTLATVGNMNFDIADAANLVTNGNWTNVILHEMGHVLGFGTLWNDNDVYVNGSGEFTGDNATSVWNTEFGQTGTPNVELEGGGGTANAHWNENSGGSGLVGITDGLGRDMRDELMTGWLNSNAFISNLTIAAFKDIGFLGAEAAPEPGTLALASLGLGAVALRRRRKKLA